MDSEAKNISKTVRTPGCAHCSQPNFILSSRDCVWRTQTAVAPAGQVPSTGSGWACRLRAWSCRILSRFSHDSAQSFRLASANRSPGLIFPTLLSSDGIDLAGHETTDHRVVAVVVNEWYVRGRHCPYGWTRVGSQREPGAGVYAGWRGTGDKGRELGSGLNHTSI